MGSHIHNQDESDSRDNLKLILLGVVAIGLCLLILFGCRSAYRPCEKRIEINPVAQ